MAGNSQAPETHVQREKEDGTKEKAEKLVTRQGPEATKQGRSRCSWLEFNVSVCGKQGRSQAKSLLPVSSE